MYYETDRKSFSSKLELKISPPLDAYGQRISNNDSFEDCPILFKLKMVGQWSRTSWIDQ